MKSSVACFVRDISGISDLTLSGTLWPPASLGFWGVCVSVCGLRWLGRVSSSSLGKILLERRCSRGTIRTGGSGDILEHFTYCGLGPSPDAGDFPTSVLPQTLSEDKHPHHPDCSPRLRMPAVTQFPWGQLHTRSRRPISRTAAEGLASICSLEQKTHYPSILC